MRIRNYEYESQTNHKFKSTNHKCVRESQIYMSTNHKFTRVNHTFMNPNQIFISVNHKQITHLWVKITDILELIKNFNFKSQICINPNF